jgi:hypothetical protein
MKNAPSHHRPRQEHDTLPPRAILYAVLGAVGFSLVLAFVSFGIQRARERDLRPSGFFPERDLGPIMERSNVHEELYSQLGRGQVLTQQGRQSLARFDWADADRKIVRVPIDVAMDLVAEETGK